MKKLGLLILVTLVFASLGTGLILNANLVQDPKVLRTIGDEMAASGQVEKAIGAYEQHLLMQEDVEVRNNLAVLYYGEKRYSEAITHLRILSDSDLTNPSFHYDLAVNLVDEFRNTDDKDVGDLREALMEFQFVEDLSPGYEHAKENSEVLRKVLG